MKKLMLLMLGLSLAAVSCKKQDTQNESTMSDSANTSGAMSDTSGTGAMPMDSAAGSRDSTMNGGANGNSPAAVPNSNNSGKGSQPAAGGTKTDSMK